MDFFLNIFFVIVETLKKSYEYLVYFLSFFFFFVLILATNNDLIFHKAAKWSKDPGLVLNVAMMVFIFFVVKKKEELSATNATIFILALLSFIFGYYGVPDFLLLN